ncbi:MAG: M1 family metallopeptidase [Flavobacteriaceae bacterium]|nr:M1 family metallopeptidase [Flavobacteriaceae bacterium]
MKLNKYPWGISIFILFLNSFLLQAQTPQGHVNNNKFKQLYDQFADPNKYHNASGAPGVEYFQQKVDYVMDIELDDEKSKLYGQETITYTNNSPDPLPYLWIQLDQNIREKDAPALEKNPANNPATIDPNAFVQSYVKDSFDGGFNIDWVQDENGKALPFKVNQTMMRVDLPKVIGPGESYVFKIKWWYNINNHVVNRARSGYEFFEEDGNKAYVIAQFFPRLCVYNDVEGWQNYQFWGNGEFALEFGDYDVNITVPSDHIMEATGSLQNPKEVLTKKEYNRFLASETSFDSPLLIVTEEEAKAKEGSFSKKKSTWKYSAKNVRDFGFATSRKFIWERQAVQLENQKVMAVSLYPKEGNPLWEEYSTKAVVQSLKTYSKFTFDYPYPKAVSVHAKRQGMEYPMICWNYGRPDKDGKYSERLKFRMISVIIHEVGHNFFPMIVNSDERQWGWMDEGLDTFVQYLTEQEFGITYPDALKGLSKYPSRRGEPQKIVSYMAGDQDFISPIMSNPENVYQLGPNAYAKPATALNILRETVMGREAFDHAFKTYAQRWMFKHPTPEDFFRTMEDASAIDLDWFWRGWFYTTDVVDIGVKKVKRYYYSDTPDQKAKKESNSQDVSNLLYKIDEDSELFDPNVLGKNPINDSKALQQNMQEEGLETAKIPTYFYEIEFEKPGGLVMPLIVEYAYADGSKERVTYPVQLWRKNDASVKKIITSDKELVGVTVDPDQETADVNPDNNSWPKKETPSDFEKFKEKIKG